MHHHSVASADVWTTYGPFVGVLIGALIGGGAQLVTSWSQHAQTRFRDTAATRRGEYFDAIDVASRMRLRLEDFASNNSGRWQPEEADHSEEAEEMRRRDSASARSFKKLNNAADELSRLTLRVRAVGSDRVLAAMDDLNDAVSGYIQGFIDDGMFKGTRYMEFREDYISKLNLLSSCVRSDLEVDRVYKPKV